VRLPFEPKPEATAGQKLMNTFVSKVRFTSRKDLLVGIGSSAGGRPPVAKILSALPLDIPASFIVVQHVDAQFASGSGVMARRADETVRPPCRNRKPAGQRLGFVSGTNDHLVFRDSSTLAYTPEPQDCAYRPSIDVFFESVARHWQGEVIGILLTGHVRWSENNTG